ncbi:MAG: hypothetical protein ACI9YB_001208 [Halioglobus sp.]
MYADRRRKKITLKKEQVRKNRRGPGIPFALFYFVLDLLSSEPQPSDVPQNVLLLLLISSQSCPTIMPLLMKP